jgi:hypothetical protein
MTIFVHGKQKRVKRPPTVEGMDMDLFIRQNADPIWLHQKSRSDEPKVAVWLQPTGRSCLRIVASRQRRLIALHLG